MFWRIDLRRKQMASHWAQTNLQPLRALDRELRCIPVVEWLRCPASAAPDPEQALANAPRQDADCECLIGVNVYGSGRPIDNHGRALNKKESDAMREIEIHDYARQLLEAHGARAIVEAAQNASNLEKQGEVELAKDWRHIEEAIKLMRGPHQS